MKGLSDSDTLCERVTQGEMSEEGRAFPALYEHRGFHTGMDGLWMIPAGEYGNKARPWFFLPSLHILHGELHRGHHWLHQVLEMEQSPTPDRAGMNGWMNESRERMLSPGPSWSWTVF